MDKQTKLSINYNTWLNNYKKIKKIDFHKFLNPQNLSLLEKLGIKIKKIKYTEYEFDLIEMLLYEYYEENKKGLLKQSKQLSNKKITKKEYEEILNQFDKISSYYNL